MNVSMPSDAPHPIPWFPWTAPGYRAAAYDPQDTERKVMMDQRKQFAVVACAQLGHLIPKPSQSGRRRKIFLAVEDQYGGWAVIGIRWTLLAAQRLCQLQADA